MILHIQHGLRMFSMLGSAFSRSMALSGIGFSTE
jgi:hypothetical protein